MSQQTTPAPPRKGFAIHLKLREYILGRAQEDFDEHGAATRLTPTEAFDELLETERAQRARARAPTKKTTRDRI